MRRLGQVLSGFLVALIPAGIVAGGISLALLEGQFSPGSFLPDLPLESPLATSPAGSALLTPIPPAATATEDIGLVLVITGTVPACPAPAGWTTFTIGLGDTLPMLASRFGIEVDALMAANCLYAEALVAGSTLYVPGDISSAASAVDETPDCGAPPGWVRYTLQPRDTLYGLSDLLGVSIQEIQFANCMGASTILISGQDLWVPRIPYRSPTPRPSATLTRTPVPSATLTATAPPPPATATSTQTPPPPTSSPTSAPVTPSPTTANTATMVPPSPTSAANATPTEPLLTATPTEMPTESEEKITATPAGGFLSQAASKQSSRIFKEPLR